MIRAPMKRSFTFCLFFATILVVAPLLAQETARIGVSGASVSAGFGSGSTLAQALATAHGQISDRALDVATSTLFLSPQKKSATLLKKIASAKPTAIVALDQLFWFAYGRKQLKTRLRDVEVALSLLEKTGVPVYVGDVPLMRNVSPIMLPTGKIPPAKHLLKVNELVRARCEKTPNLHLLPLTAWAEAMRNGRTLNLFGKPRTYKKSQLFIADGLHVNRRGLAVLTMLVAERLQNDKVLAASTSMPDSPDDLAERLKGCRLEVRLVNTAGRRLKQGIVSFDLSALRSKFPSVDFAAHERLRRLTEPFDLSYRNPFFIPGLPGALIGESLQLRLKTDGDLIPEPILLTAGRTRATITLQ